jgi:hypothetical protein
MSAWSNDQPTSLTIPPGAGPSEARIVIGSSVPAELTAFYAAVGLTITSAILFYQDADNYQYMLVCPNYGTTLGTRGPVNGVQETCVIGSDAQGFARFDLSFINQVLWSDGNAGMFGIEGLHAVHPVVGTLTQETWQAPVYQNSWHDQGGGFAPLQYRFLASPPEALQISGCASGGTFADGTIVFNLPTGYRPTATHVILNSPGGRLTVDTAGNIKTFGLSTNFIQLEAVFDISRF